MLTRNYSYRLIVYVSIIDNMNLYFDVISFSYSCGYTYIIGLLLQELGFMVTKALRNITPENNRNGKFIIFIILTEITKSVGSSCCDITI